MKSDAFYCFVVAVLAEAADESAEAADESAEAVGVPDSVGVGCAAALAEAGDAAVSADAGGSTAVAAEAATIAAAAAATVVGLFAISCRIAASRTLKFLARSEFGKTMFAICCWTIAKRTSAGRNKFNVGFAETCAITTAKKSAKITLLIFTDS